ncbi:MAG: ABC transporter ATP-binding protein [Erysipelotrichaceae bacterium]
MISVKHLTKYYVDFLAVDDLSFEISGGGVYGFLGPNGAGKSTTMNIMTGCLSSNEGEILIDGINIFEEPEKAKASIGYLMEFPPLYTNETVREYLTFVGEAKGLKKDILAKQLDEAIEQTGLRNRENKLISSLSKGYRQRVGIAQALLNNPKVIILDEPTVGLDPIQIIEIRDLIKELGKSHTVIFSSHILSEVQAICSDVLIINKGKLIAYDKPENLVKHLLGKNTLVFVLKCMEIEMIRLLDYFKDDYSKRSYEVLKNGYIRAELSLKNNDVYGFNMKLFDYCVNKKIRIVELVSKKANLEDVFIELTENHESEVNGNVGSL